jgi:diguanylate cyclase (GGDEF)-like protein
MTQMRGLGAEWRRAAPLSRLSWLLVAVALGWFVVNLVHPVGPAALLWITTPFGGAAGAGAFWQASRRGSLPDPARRFWRHMMPVVLLVAFGQTASAVDAVRHPDVGGEHTGPFTLYPAGVAILIIIYALYRLPTGKASRDEAMRVFLDAGTVMLATAVFIWHFTTRQELGTTARADLAGSLLLIVLANFAVFALVKVLLSDYRVVDGRGLRLLAAAILIGALEPMFQPLLTAYDPRLFVAQIGIPLIFHCAVVAAARQGRTPLGARPATARRRRSFSLLPYAAVAGVDGLLLWVAVLDVTDIVVVAAAAVGLTAIVVMRQISALVTNGRLVEQLDHSANHDPLTGLPNRMYYNRRLHQALAASGGRQVSLALLDLDDFKVVNDTLGHEVGDILLIAVAERLRFCIRAQDTVARLGGDEFVLILDDADRETADQVIGRVAVALADPVVTGGQRLPIRASIGVADGRSGDDASVLLRRADIAMYAAKNVTGTAALHYDQAMAVAAL